MSWIMIVAAVLFVAAWVAVAVTAIVLSRRAGVGDHAVDPHRYRDLVTGARNRGTREAILEAMNHPLSVRYRHSDDG